MATEVRLEVKLNDFDREVRLQALAELAARARRGEVQLEPEAESANLHCHTFFSFNASGHSPASLAWLARRRGIKLAGIVDFDVLDGVDEFLEACDLLGLRGTAGIETRVFVPEYATKEINSLGEPGVCYHMGIGFTTGIVPESVAPTLTDLRRRAGQRNRDILSRINAHLSPVTVDYDRDVLPLTPGGNPTERHLVLALLRAVERPASSDAATFWSTRLAVRPEELEPLLPDSPPLQNLVRSRLMKSGGVGYVRPESGMFPTLEVFQSLITTCGALPCAAWLDGTTAAEQEGAAWLAFLADKGAVALNIIPDRNWNIADAQVRRLKVHNLHQVVEAAQELDLPLHVGTEMNSFGQKVVDDFDAPELAPLRRYFLDGAYFVYGHTALQRALGLGYHSPWAQAYLPTRRQRNRFYTRLGQLVPPGPAGLALLRRIDPAAEPAGFLVGLARQ